MHIEKSFYFSGKGLNVINQDYVNYFEIVEVCRILNISDIKCATSLLDKDELAVRNDNNYRLVNESGLYSLISQSKNRNRKRFRKFITLEVLPTMGEMMTNRKKCKIGSKREATAMNTASLAVRRANKLEREMQAVLMRCQSAA